MTTTARPAHPRHWHGMNLRRAQARRLSLLVSLVLCTFASTAAAILTSII